MNQTAKFSELIANCAINTRFSRHFSGKLQTQVKAGALVLNDSHANGQ